MTEEASLKPQNLSIRIAGEIEFYLATPLSDSQENDFLAKLLLNLTQQNITIWNIQKEVAPNQYEVSLQPADPETAIKNTNLLKKIISTTAQEFSSSALFKAKPFEHLPGCGLHIHIGVYDSAGKPALGRKGKFGDREGESETMLHAIGGLCETMLKNFIHFAPNEASYKRFTAARNPAVGDNPLQAYNNAPVNVSWGGNNRTTAIRIPVSTIDEDSRHIEHRVAGADADVASVINAIVEGIYSGIKNKISPPEKIYGNAFDKQYSHLKPFPKTLDEAKKLSL
jgi:glutamine synthetase